MCVPALVAGDVEGRRRIARGGKGLANRLFEQLRGGVLQLDEEVAVDPRPDPWREPPLIRPRGSVLELAAQLGREAPGAEPGER